MGWIKVLPVDSLPQDARKVVKVGKRNILLLYHDNQLVAIDNACPHMKLPLKNGKITEDGAIVCPWHRSAFDLRTGDVREWITWPPVVGTALNMMSRQQALSVFPVRVEEESIWVEVEEE